MKETKEKKDSHREARQNLRQSFLAQHTYSNFIDGNKCCTLASVNLIPEYQNFFE